MTTSEKYPEIAAIARRALMEAVRKEIAGKTKEWFAPVVKESPEETEKEHVQDNPENYYIVNSDQKVELHFDYGFYKALPQSVKSEIKRYFVWGRQRNAWVSKSQGGDRHFTVASILKQLNIPLLEKHKRKSYRDTIEEKIGKAESRAERYKDKADKSISKATAMQAEFNRLRKDWSWLTQPSVNTSSGRRFTNQRNKVVDRYEKGVEEFLKSERYKERSISAKNTAEMIQLQDIDYVERKIKEAKTSIKKFLGYVENYKKELEKLKDSDQTDEKQDKILKWIESSIERIDYEGDKLHFLLGKKQEIINRGHIVYTKEYLENMGAKYIKRKETWYEIIRLNPTTVTHSWMHGSEFKTRYTDIQEVK